MFADKETTSPFEYKPCNPEARNRKIENARRSAQLSLLSPLKKTSQYNDSTPSHSASTPFEENKIESPEIFTFKKITYPETDTGSPKTSEDKTLVNIAKPEVKSDLTQEKTPKTNCPESPELSSSLNNFENTAGLTDPSRGHKNKQASEDVGSNQSTSVGDFIFSPLDSNQPYHSVFFSGPKNEAEELKEDLQIEDLTDIYFIHGDFFTYYHELEILGEGASGTVKKCTKVGTDQVFAVKVIRYRGDTERLLLEIKEFENHKRLNHRNIIKVYELYIDYVNKKTYLVMELVECMEMLEVIQDFGSFDEALSAKILKQVISGINYLHLHGVCHRDLKPANILISQDGEMVKIVDFNVSKFSKSQEYTAISNQNYKMWTQTGTIAFSAPEVFNDSQYTESVDMWSVGVILYTMLCGYQPFQADNVPELIEKIKQAAYEFHADPWDKISSDAKDLIKNLLTIDVKKRFSPFEALVHPWIENLNDHTHQETNPTEEDNELNIVVRNRKLTQVNPTNPNTNKFPKFQRGTSRNRTYCGIYLSSKMFHKKEANALSDLPECEEDAHKSSQEDTPEEQQSTTSDPKE